MAQLAVQSVPITIFSQDNAIVKDKVVWEVQKQKETINSLAQKSNRILFKVSTFFPFDLFRDDVIVDENKLTVITREFFLSERVHSMRIETIAEIFVDVGPIFATIEIVEKDVPNSKIRVRYILKKDAMKLRKIVQGLILAKEKKIDLSVLDNKELLEKIEEIGRAKEID